MKRALLMIAFISIGVITASARQAQFDGEKEFQQLVRLAGHWEGTYEWSGARTGKGEVIADYSLTGFGSALVESLIQGGKPSMMSVYHLDGNDLRVTHYCAARNQPRLIADKVDAASGQVDFKFVDITNLKSPESGHVSGISLRSLSDKHINLIFRFIGNGKESTEVMDLWRRKT